MLLNTNKRGVANRGFTRAARHAHYNLYVRAAKVAKVAQVVEVVEVIKQPLAVEAVKVAKSMEVAVLPQALPQVNDGASSPSQSFAQCYCGSPRYYCRSHCLHQV